MTRTEIAKLGGLALFKKLGVKHMSKIGKKGAAKFYEKYSVLPIGTNKWAIISKETNLVIKIRNS